LFKASVKWLLQPGRVDEWGILSAKHGLVMPDRVLEPYELALQHLNARDRERWAARVHDEIVAQWGTDTIYRVLMGGDYRAALDGLMVEDPVACWTQWRIDQGMTRRRAAMGIGLILKALNENRSYY
jgi:hypothetical protein